ncbi:LrgB-like family-domain-containing protein [Lineolata rhizophorae]|uniref:LrgB-like family-domain-containing protein n=1 Tax=Lineolata rhizophorae TaxID=578093 RepID=A0A6A6NUS0_9PEZI|nr:LrgB-like family-domain-containing protein [Lineolata rhizophorae]
MSERELRSIFRDGVEAIALVARSSWRRLLTAWVYVPIGIMIVLFACFGVDSLIRLSSVSFPASVACMIILFFVLIALEPAVGERRVRTLVQYIDIPGGFALRYINVLFTPSFILIPLGSPITGTEIAKVIGVFVIGYFAMFALTAYLVRLLQLILGTSKRALTERAEEIGPNETNDPGSPSADPSTPSLASSAQPLLPPTPPPEPAPPARTQDPSLITGTGGPPEASTSPSNAIPANPTTLHPFATQSAPPLTRAQRWAAQLNARLDATCHGLLFICVGLPVYYGGPAYAMPAQLCVNVLAYHAALRLPARWRRVAHPVPVAAGVTLLAVWALAASRGEGFLDGLRAYRTRAGYVQMLRGELGAPNTPRPGAGDVLGSVLDVSIVALALPMWQYRKELTRHYGTILVPSLALSVGSLLLYPPLCAWLGISPPRALSFASRSLTLALGMPATANLDGDLSLVAVLCIASGILGVLLGNQLLGWLRIREDDYITRGVAMGVNSSAMGTARLLEVDPRAAAFSCLSMSVFGTAVVVGTSIPPMAGVVRGWAGAE